ncbi:MAG: DUF1294 domain-containing protein [Clostridia bacterium]|nr:DUF1294 domain-containing protein [Clostridia bacterium]
MEGIFPILLTALGICSAICFLTFGLDKLLAVWGKRRIRERTLHLMLWLFGAPGGFLGMCVFRHKTAHDGFWLSAVGGLILQMLLLLGGAYFTYT